MISPSSFVSPASARGHDSIVLPFLPDSMWIFLYSLSCTGNFLPVSKLFSKGLFHMYRIFDEFMGRGELSTLLFHHLGLVTYICFFLQSFSSPLPKAP